MEPFSVNRNVQISWQLRGLRYQIHNFFCLLPLPLKWHSNPNGHVQVLPLCISLFAICKLKFVQFIPTELFVHVCLNSKGYRSNCSNWFPVASFMEIWDGSTGRCTSYRLIRFFHFKYKHLHRKSLLNQEASFLCCWVERSFMQSSGLFLWWTLRQGSFERRLQKNPPTTKTTIRILFCISDMVLGGIWPPLLVCAVHRCSRSSEVGTTKSIARQRTCQQAESASLGIGLFSLGRASERRGGIGGWGLSCKCYVTTFEIFKPNVETKSEFDFELGLIDLVYGSLE